MSFPTTSVLDNFNRANESPMTGWSIINSSGTDMKVLSNKATSNGSSSLGMAYWNAGNFGPDSEAYVTISTVGSASTHRVLVGVRIQGEGGASTWDGYIVRYTWVSGASNDILEIMRVTNNAFTQLASITQEISAGDSIGISAVGNILTAYYKASGGSWASAGTYDITSDGTKYTAAGKIMLGVQTTTPQVDDFGGGTVAGAVQNDVTLSCSGTTVVSGSTKSAGKIFVA